MKTFSLRLPDHLMAQVRQAAETEGVSINQLLTVLVAEGVGHLRGLNALEARAARADADEALAVLAKVPDAAPLDGDEWEAPPRVRRRV